MLNKCKMVALATMVLMSLCVGLALAADPDFTGNSVELSAITDDAVSIVVDSLKAAGATVAYPVTQMPVISQSVPIRVFAFCAFQLEATSEGQSLSLAFEAPAAGNYELILYCLQVGTYGIYNIKIDGTQLTKENFYSSIRDEGPISLGTMQLAAGKHTIDFENAGKDDNSSNYKMVVYGLGLRPIK